MVTAGDIHRRDINTPPMVREMWNSSSLPMGAHNPPQTEKFWEDTLDKSRSG